MCRSKRFRRPFRRVFAPVSVKSDVISMSESSRCWSIESSQRHGGDSLVERERE